MFGTLFAFELRSHFRRPVTWLYVAIVFFMAFFAVSTDSFVTGQVLGKVKKNSPYSLAQLYSILLAVGQIITSALVGTTVLRDYEAGVHEILFSTRITRRAYLGAKYIAALLAMLLVFAALPIGALVGTVMPWADTTTLQSINAWHYVQPFLLIGVPGVFFISSALFAVGSLTRSSFSVYVTGILLLVGYSIGDELIRQLDRDQLANLLDPFAIRSLDLVTRYWTPVQKNSLTLPFDGFIGQNRLLWSSIGAVLLAVTFRFVKLEKHAAVSSRKKQKAEEKQFVPSATLRRAARSYEPTPAFAGCGAWPSSTPARCYGPRRSWRSLPSASSTCS